MSTLPAQIDTVKSKILNYFKNKYPTSFETAGITEPEIGTLVAKIITPDQTPASSKQKINNLISLLERKIKENMYSENRLKRTVNTNKYTMDPDADIKYTTYVDTPFSTVHSLQTPSATKPPESANNDVNAYAKLFEIDKESILDASGVSKDNILRTQFKDLLHPEERPFIYNIIIDSKDRDTVKYPNPASFVIDFSPPESQGGTSGDINRGYISIAFGNIISCELLDIILLDTSTENDSSDSTTAGNTIPYIILDIQELGTNYYGTNDELSRCFATLTSYELLNGYKHYNINAINSNHTIAKVYNPRINLNRMTIKLKLPDGTPYSFGSANNTNTDTVIKISFRITTLQKNLSTGFINKALY
jgi:hypothetical protein